MREAPLLTYRPDVLFIKKEARRVEKERLKDGSSEDKCSHKETAETSEEQWGT